MLSHIVIAAATKQFAGHHGAATAASSTAAVVVSARAAGCCPSGAAAAIEDVIGSAAIGPGELGVLMCPVQLGNSLLPSTHVLEVDKRKMDGRQP